MDASKIQRDIDAIVIVTAMRCLTEKQGAIVKDCHENASLLGVGNRISISPPYAAQLCSEMMIAEFLAQDKILNDGESLKRSIFRCKVSNRCRAGS